MCRFICRTICNLIFVTALTVGYWALLYKTTWAHGVAIASIVFFAFGLAMHIVLIVFALIALCCAGIALSFAEFSLAVLVVAIIVVIFILLVVTFQFGIALAGLLFSIDLLNSGGQTCPIDGGTCQWLIILFFITMFLGGMRGYSKKKEENSSTNFDRVGRSCENRNANDQTIEVVDAGITTGETPNNNSDKLPSEIPMVIISSFLFNPQNAQVLRTFSSQGKSPDVELAQRSTRI
uniref:Uncharacterized protein n=1 Tax=Panagrolaimus sp. JU765 TaxID=591449 RepID=A0AC34RDZ0_9BILA